MSARRMLPFIFINILVSAAVVLAILFWWEGRDVQTVAVPLPTQPLLVVTDPLPATVGVLTPEEESGAENGDGPVLYQVQAGDTLGTISQQFEVPMADILAVNDIPNADVLSVGQELLIPVGGIPTPTPPATAAPTPNTAPTPIPTEAIEVGEADVQITQVIGAGVLTDEAVVIANLGNRPVALVNWRLLDPNGREYRFGQLTLFGDGSAITLHTEAGIDTLGNIFWGLEEAIWSTGETLTLVDSEGTTQAQFTIP